MYDSSSEQHLDPSLSPAKPYFSSSTVGSSGTTLHPLARLQNAEPLDSIKLKGANLPNSSLPVSWNAPQDFRQSLVRRRLSLLAAYTSELPPESTLSVSELANRRPTLKHCTSMKRPPKPSFALRGGYQSMDVKLPKVYRTSEARIRFSMSQLTHVALQESYEVSHDKMKERIHRRSCVPVSVLTSVHNIRDDLIGVPFSPEASSFHREYVQNLQEIALKRKSTRNRKKWQRSYRKAVSLMRIIKNMAERSLSFEKEQSTYVDIGDTVTMFVDYGAGRSLDLDRFKRKKEISISHETFDILSSIPEERTLVQLEKARRALQIAPVFSEYPLDVQEQILRRAFYLVIGPKRVILRQGHIAHNYYIIICGEAYVKKHVWDEEKQQMVAKTEAFIKTGDTFGSEALIDGVDRSSSVISRTNMQLLAISGEDYLDLIVRTSVPGQLPSYIQYLSDMNFMENFPIHLLKGKLSVCALHHFRRNAVITHDSKNCREFIIIKHGYCKVFGKLQGSKEMEKENTKKISRTYKESKEMVKEKTRQMSQTSKKSTDSVSSDLIQQQRFPRDLLDDQRYIERDSPHVSYKELRTPMGNIVRMPVVKALGKDKMYQEPLTLPKEQRKFVPLMLLREGEVFGMDQCDLCPLRDKSRSTILVSLGAEVITLNKDFYCRHAAPETWEVFEKTFIYDDILIGQRLRSNVNRDVHLEEVLNFYFLKMDNSQSPRHHAQLHL